MVQYHTVFEITNQHPPIMVIALNVVFPVLMTIVAVVVWIKTRRLSVIVMYALVIVVYFTLFSNVGSAVNDMYDRARQAYARGEFSVVEGPVADFRTFPNQHRETFTVRGVRFSYSERIVVPCFRDTASHGGPIHEGLLVRVSYSDNCIYKLEVGSTVR